MVFDTITPSSDSSINRRSVVKAAGASLLGTGLAGCTGNGSDDGDGGDSNGGADTTAQAGDESDFSNVTVEYADTGFSDVGRFAAQTIDLWVSEWSAETGGDVNLTQPSDEGLAEQFQNDEQPHMITASPGDTGVFLPDNLLTPYSEFQDTFPDYLDGGLHPGMAEITENHAFRGWGDVYYLQLTTKPYAPIIGNMDHFEETPGLSPDDFPPESWDELVEQATALQEEGPSEIGYQPYGSSGDLMDVEWNQVAGANPAGGNPSEAYTYGDDWSTINWNNDTWKEWMGAKVDAHTEHGLGSPGTATFGDEEGIPGMINGQIGMCHQASSANSIFQNQASEMFEDGTLRWGTTWGGESGLRANHLQDGVSYAQKPEGKDEANWEKSVNAAEDFTKFLLGTELFRDDFVTGMGFCPAWKGDWDNMAENDRTTAGGWLSAVKPMVDEAEAYRGYSAHPYRSTHDYDVIPQEVQKAFNGEISTDQALENATEIAQKQLDDDDGEWKSS